MRHLDQIVAIWRQVRADPAEVVDNLIVGEETVEAVIKRGDDIDWPR